MNSLSKGIILLEGNIGKGLYGPNELNTVRKVIRNLKWLNNKIEIDDEKLIEQMFEPSKRDLRIKNIGNRYYQK